MKLNRRDLRSLIESMIYEVNPIKGRGSSLDMMNKMSKQAASGEIQVKDLSNVPGQCMLALQKLQRLQSEMQKTQDESDYDEQVELINQKFKGNVKSIENFDDDFTNAFKYYKIVPDEKIKNALGISGTEAFDELSQMIQDSNAEAVGK